MSGKLVEKLMLALVQDVAIAMAQAMLKMPFTEDCLCQLMDKELAEVLTNIPFDVDEMSIVLAVQQWAELNLMDDDDEVRHCWSIARYLAIASV